MKKLMSSLTRMGGIERKIFEHGGELCSFTEQELIEAEIEIRENIESVAYAYKKRQMALEHLKAAYKHAVKKESQGLEHFKQIILHSAKTHGQRLKTPLASISVSERISYDVIIFDFDETIEECPEALTITIEDNVKKLTLSKKILKEHYAKKQGGVNGYDISERKIQYPNVRVKGWDTNVAITDDSE